MLSRPFVIGLRDVYRCWLSVIEKQKDPVVFVSTAWPGKRWERAMHHACSIHGICRMTTGALQRTFEACLGSPCPAKPSLLLEELCNHLRASCHAICVLPRDRGISESPLTTTNSYSYTVPCYREQRLHFLVAEHSRKQYQTQRAMENQRMPRRYRLAKKTLSIR